MYITTKVRGPDKFYFLLNNVFHRGPFEPTKGSNCFSRDVRTRVTKETYSVVIFQGGMPDLLPPSPSGSAHGFQITTMTLESKSKSICTVLRGFLTAGNLKPPSIFERVFIFCAKVPMVCRLQRRCPITDVTLESKVKV